MRNIRAYITILIFDILAMALGFVASGWLSFFIADAFFDKAPGDMPLIYIMDRVYSFSVLSFVVIFALYNRGHYKRRIPWWNQVRFILIIMIAVVFVDGFIHFAIKYQFSRLWIVTSWLLSFCFILIGRIISRILCETSGVWKIPTVVIGSGDNAIDTLFAVHSDSYTGYDIKTMILHGGYKDFNREVLPLGYRDINILDGADDYNDYFSRHNNHFYIIAPDSFSDIDVEKMIAAMEEVGAEYAIVPPIKGISLYSNRPQYFFGHDIMMIQQGHRIKSPLGRILKRGVDIIGSIILLITLSPVFLIISLLIMREGGTAFFKNRRIGRGNKAFDCLKFRSMVPNAEKILDDLLEKDAEAKALWETHRKMKNDPRITSIGRFLRKSSLDELPQIINVLKGEMSLVGPRPILPDETIFFEKDELANYMSVRPGITGLWQVSGRNNTSFKQRVHLDNWYIKNWSLWYDIVIMFKTITVILKRSGAY